MTTPQYEALFLAESREHVAEINRHLLELERDPAGSDIAAGVSALFRAVHTIKGMAASMGYNVVAELAHDMEAALDQLRRMSTAPSAALLEALFEATDVLEAGIEQAVRGEEPPESEVARARLRAALDPDHATGAGNGMLVQLVIDRSAPLPGVRAYMALEAARALGTVNTVVPAEARFGEEGFDGLVAFRLATTHDAAAVGQALRRVGDVVDVRIDGAAATPAAAPAPRAGTDTPATGRTVGEPSTRQHVRIDLRRLDALMNLIGELVVTRGRLQQLAATSANAALDDTVNEASRLIADLRDEITASRLVPAGQVFDRFPRLVRDLARSQGKEVDFHLDGGDIELDRAMLDDLADSLVHLLRNAIDHGIEGPAERVAAGKPRAGQLVLSAARERSAAVIRVTDDGRGIDRTRVLARAKADGLVDLQTTELSEDDLLRLLTRPGFSTADRVTNVSGRGVGVDAVFTRIRGLGGAMDVRSEPGQGTSIMLRLPLTLAIVRAVLARVGDEIYAIPAAHVSEVLELDDDVVAVVHDREMLRVRDEVVPLLRLRSLVQLPLGAALATLPQVVVLDLGDRQAGLVVDELLRQEEIVVKQYDAVRDGATLFGGATLLADGTPALILDVSSVV